MKALDKTRILAPSDYFYHFSFPRYGRLKSKFLCERYSHCIFSSCSIDLTKTRYTWSLTAVVMPKLRRWNGGNLEKLCWQQDGATVHVTDRNLDTLSRVISRRPICSIDWPARSPDLPPLDFCLWGYLKSKIFNCGGDWIIGSISKSLQSKSLQS